MNEDHPVFRRFPRFFKTGEPVPARQGVGYFPEFRDWLEYGITIGYCSIPSCNTHEGPALTDDEWKQFDDGDDPCVPIVRLYAIKSLMVHDEH